MAYLCQTSNVPSLIDVFSTWDEDAALFDLLTGAPWEDEVASAELNLEYFGNRSGSKICAPIVLRLLGENDVLSQESRQKLANIILARFLKNWNRLWDVYNAEYSSVRNYDVTIERQLQTTDDAVDTTDRDLTRTGTETFQHGETETITHGKTETTTDNLTETVTHGKTERTVVDSTDTTTHGKTETTTDNLNETVTHGKTERTVVDSTDTTTHGKTETDTHSVQGFNSATYQPATQDASNEGGTTSEAVDATTTVTDGGTTATANTGTRTVADGGTTSEDVDATTTVTDGGTTATANTGTRQVADSGTTREATDSTTTVTDGGTTETENTGTRTIADSGTDTHAHTGSDTQTRNLTDTDDIRRVLDRDGTEDELIHRYGNIGRDPQAMLEKEIALWKWNFFERVYRDIDSVLSLAVYDLCRI